MSKQINISSAATFIPSSFDSVNSVYDTTGGDNNNGIYQTNYIENGFTDATSSTRAAIYSKTGSRAVTYIYYNFDCSAIPSAATINSVSCVFKGGTQGSTYYSAYTAQLCSGTATKGTAQSVTGTNSSPSTVTLTGGTWTRSELDNAKILFKVTRGTSNTNSGSTVSFYGATLTVDYSYSGTVYEITSTLSTNNVDSISPTGVTDVEPGGSYQLEIHATSLDDFTIEDNGVDVKNQLVEQTAPQSGSVSNTATGSTNSGLSSGSNYASYPVGYTAENPHTYTSNMYASNNSTGYVDYNFDFSNIPEGATIDSVEVKCCGQRENATVDSTHMAKISLYSGNTLKGTAQEFTSTSQQTITITDPGTWTRSELQSAKLRFSLAYYGGRMYGITWTVNYSFASGGGTYWTYSLSNVQADHTIILMDAIIEIPDEDPQYDYYPITISSINATTDPGRGTTRIVEGSNQTITIYPSDPLVTLITDNGVDVSSQLVQHGSAISDPTVATAAGASYGFNLNTSTGYYVSSNSGVSSSAAVCRVSFDLPVRCLVTIQFINSGEATYDFGVFGKVDTTLSTTGWTASQSAGDTTTDAGLEQLRCNTSQYNSTSPQTLTYEIPSGQHYIDIKYGKDQSTNSGNDTLQWKITDIEPLEANNYYTYTLSNINEAHSLIFIFGDVQYYFVNSSGTGCKLYPSGQMVVLPGESYSITVVPDDYSYTVAMTDNGSNVDSSVERKEQEVTKDGETYTVVNYIYRITNVQATHNLVITCFQEQNLNLYIKVNGTYTPVTSVYKKVNGVWNKQDIEALTEHQLYFYHETL